MKKKKNIIQKKSKLHHKMSKNLKSQKSQKNHLFQNKKNAILLVLPNEEISLRPELSRPPRFRIQGGWSERYGGRMNELTNGNPCV